MLLLVSLAVNRTTKMMSGNAPEPKKRDAAVRCCGDDNPKISCHMLGQPMVHKDQEVVVCSGSDGPQRSGGCGMLRQPMVLVVEALELEHQRNAEQITQGILRRWIDGRGRKPITWRTLVDVLRECQLNST